MATTNALKRYHLIINTLHQKNASLQEIKEIIYNAFIDINDFTYSTRTFIRDCKGIEDLFGIEIIYNRKEKHYELQENNLNDFNKRYIESYDIINVIQTYEDISKFVLFENRKFLGTATKNLNTILSFIKNRNRIGIIYQQYYEKESTYRVIEPYALKEFKQRWYVIANDVTENIIKTFALDRIDDKIVPTNTRFTTNAFNPSSYFDASFGIVKDEGKEAEEIIISCSAFQGKYFKSLPLHKSQKIIVDNEKEFKFSITVQVTYDLLIELLSYGANIKVHSPQSVINELTNHYKNALKRYKIV